MKKISEDTYKKLACQVVDSIEENMGVGGIAAIGPAQAGNTFGTLGSVGSSGSGTAMPTGVGNAPAKSDGDGKSATSNTQSGKNDIGKLPKQSEIQVLALVNKVNGPLGRNSNAVGNVPAISTTVSGVKATIDQIGSGKKK